MVNLTMTATVDEDSSVENNEGTKLLATELQLPNEFHASRIAGRRHTRRMQFICLLQDGKIRPEAVKLCHNVLDLNEFSAGMLHIVFYQF